MTGSDSEKDTGQSESATGTTAEDASDSLVHSTSDLKKTVSSPQNDLESGGRVVAGEDEEGTGGLDRVSTRHSFVQHDPNLSPAITRRDSDGWEIDDKGRIIVDWEGPDDPENPKNWKSSRKIFNVVIIAAMTFVCPLSSSAFAPALPQVQADFNTTTTLAAFSVSVFVLGFGIGPLLLAPMSETFGRKPLYIVGYAVFIAMNVGSALATSINMLIAVRFLAGFFGSAGISNGGGTISDMYNAIQRTRVVGWYVLGPLTGPTIGPLMGGFVAESLGWRWVFWIILIVSCINTLGCILFLRESYAPVLLARKAALISKQSGRPARPRVFDPRPLHIRIKVAIRRPVRILFCQPVVFFMASYMALIYGTLYLLFTTFASVFGGQYGFPPGLIGLTYLGIGVGFLIGIIFGIPQIDKIYRRLTAKNNGVNLPEYRIPMANVGAVCLPISLLWYGWSVQENAHYIVPILGTVPFGIGNILIFNSVQNYFIDSYTRYAASAVAAGNNHSVY